MTFQFILALLKYSKFYCYGKGGQHDDLQGGGVEQVEPAVKSCNGIVANGGTEAGAQTWEPFQGDASQWRKIQGSLQMC